MSLPLPWIDRVFDRLSLVYGAAFGRRYADLNLDAVKANWAEELSGFRDHPDAIAYALANLPTDYPPTVLQFRDLCRAAPAPTRPQLPAPHPTPSVVSENLAKAREMAFAGLSRGGVEWAKRAIAAHERGERINPTRLRMAREALGIKRQAEEEGATDAA